MSEFVQLGANADAPTIASTIACAPYKICKAPQILYSGDRGGPFELITSMMDKKILYKQVFVGGLILEEFFSDKNMKKFISLFSTPVGCVFEAYWRPAGHRVENGVLCLLCGKFISIGSKFYSENFMLFLKGHVAKYHCFTLLEPITGGYYDDANYLIYCDFRQIYYYNTTHNIDYFEDTREQLKNTTNCYLCILCGKRYAVTPSQEVVLLHIKKCKYVRDRVNNLDLSRYKAPQLANTMIA